MRKRNAVTAILLAVAMLLSIIGGENNMLTQAASDSNELDKWVLADSANDPADTLECVWDSEEHGLVLKKTEHFTEATTAPNASAIDKVFKEIGIEGNTKYQLSFDIKGEGNSPIYLVHAFFYNAEGTSMLSQQYSIVSDTAIPQAAGWQHVTCDVTSPENAGRIQIRVQSYSGTATEGDAIYLDNVRLQKYVWKQPEAKCELMTLYENGNAAGTGNWYHSKTSSFSKTSYMEIVEEGCDGDAGALHVVSAGAQGDLEVAMQKTIPAGTYTIQMQVKGSVANYNDGSNKFEVRTDNEESLLYISKQQNYSDWTLISGEFTTNGFSGLKIFLSQYCWQTDFYIDNIIITDTTGADILDGAGNYSRSVEPYELLPVTNGYSADSVWYGYNGSTGVKLADGIVSIVAEGCNGDPGALRIHHTYNCGYDIYVKLVLPEALPAGTYTISANTKGNSNQQAFYVACKSGTGNDLVFFEDTTNCVASEWKNFSGEVTIPAGYKEIYVGVSNYQETADLYIDNIRLINQADNKDYFADYGNFGKKAEAKEVADEFDMLEGSGSFEGIYDVFTTGSSGNVNKDSVTDIRDLVHMKRYLKKLLSKTDMAEDSDLTGDRLVKQDDENALRQILLAEPQYRLLTIADAYPGMDAWYFIKPGKGTAEIVEDGRDKGALHFVKETGGEGGSETILGFDLSGAETGDYTLKLYVKGTANAGGEIAFYQQDTQQLKLFSGNLNAADWTEYSGTLHITKVEGASTLFRINFGGYVGISDLYIDNITLTDSEGKDVLCGKGTFSEVVTTP